jgi:site-specific DNA-methyltransferase (adenine-specific)
MGASGDLETGVIYCEDNLSRLRLLPSESVDLIYLDPPFFSNKNYEVIWGDEAEVRSFEDRWEGGINLYVGWMRDRVMEMHRLLKPTGSLYLHCDWHASHYLKVMMDGFFGYSMFANEIIWKRADTVKGNFGQGSRSWGANTDTILFYRKTAANTFNPLFKPYSDEYVRRFYRYTEPETGRRFRLISMTGPGGAAKGNPQYEVMGVTRYWRYSKERMRRLIDAGLVVQTRPGAVPQRKQYLDEGKGVPIQSLWDDVPGLHAQAKERLGYPTQKPEALLGRIIGASSRQGDVVLDPFCGCGTSISVAEQLGRRWVGIDISPTAVSIMKARVEKLGGTEHPTEVRVVGMPTSEDQLRRLKPFEFQNWVIQRVDGAHSPRKTGDMGIDGFSFLERAPIQIKRSDRVGRPVVDNFETAIERHGANKGYVVAFSFTRGAHEEAARVNNAKGLEIELVTVKELLLGTSELVAPVLNRAVLDLPLPPARPRDARPTAEELVASDEQSEEVA